MQGTHFSEEQVIRILHDAEATGNVRYAGHLYGVTWRSWPLCPSTCARAASACGNQKVMSMVRYRCMAMVSSPLRAHPSSLAIQGAEAPVAVGLEWAHAGLRPGREPGSSGWQRTRPLGDGDAHGTRREAVGRGLRGPVPDGLGELQGVLRLGIRLVQTASQQIGLTQPGHPQRMVEHVTHGHSLLDRLLQRQRVGGPSGKRIGSPHERGDSGDEQPEAPPARGRGAFEHRDGLLAVPLA